MIEHLARESTQLKPNDFVKRLVDTPYVRAVFKRFQNQVPPGASHTVSELYNEYLRMWRQKRIHDGVEVRTVPNFTLPPIAFKTKKKQKVLAKSGWTPRVETGPPNFFPLKSNSKYYTLHTASPDGSYQVDLMYFDTFAYYLFVEVNSRWAYIVPANSSSDDWGFKSRTHESAGAPRLRYRLHSIPKAAISVNDYARALDDFFTDVHNCSSLRGDAQASFTGHHPIIEGLYKRAGVVFEPVRRIVVGEKGKTEPYHQQLGIIDRITRTIRDMLYNIGVSDPVYPVIAAIVNQYNDAPHDTLTKYGPGFPVSPNMVHEDGELRFYIVRAICQENVLTSHRQEFRLAPHQHVAVFNKANKFDKRRSRVLPEVFEVLGYKDGAYGVKSLKDNRVLIVPRTELRPEGAKRDE
jgi:hypothetical protein